MPTRNGRQAVEGEGASNAVLGRRPPPGCLFKATQRRPCPSVWDQGTATASSSTAVTPVLWLPPEAIYPRLRAIGCFLLQQQKERIGGKCRTYNYLFTKTGHKPTEAFTQRKSDCFSLVACCRRAVQEPLRGVNELHTIKYPVTAERIASDQIFRPGIPDFG